MLKISKKIEYSLIVLQHFKNADSEQHFSARQLSKQYKLPFDPVSRVMQIMKSHHILNADKGSKGGYTLKADLNNIAYFELLKILENISEKTVCESKKCQLQSTCNITDPIHKLNMYTNKLFQNISLEQLLNGQLK